MTLSSTQILQALSADPLTPTSAGELDFLRRRASQYGTQALTAPETELLDALQTQASKPASPPIPSDAGEISGHGLNRGESGPLSPAAVAWIQRLPSDPTRITMDDARALADLEQQVPTGSPDHRLVRSVLEPVRTHHRALAAQVRLGAARNAPPVAPPAAAVRALADAYVREDPTLTTDQAQRKAQAATNDITNRRRQAHQNLLATLRADTGATV